MDCEISFVKMHGLGNDFVIVDSSSLIGLEYSDVARFVSNRRFGVGCDQFIIYTVQKGVYSVQIYNSDGSAAYACGNAMRCIAKLIYGLFNIKNITLNVAGRLIVSEVSSIDTINVNMGRASFDSDWMPKLEDIWSFAKRYGLTLKDVICVDVSNPHLVIYGSFSKKDQFTIGSLLQQKTLFVDGINVNFVDIRGGKIYLSVWERGSGLTLACGSGACASFAASHNLGFVASNAEVVFEHGSLWMSKINDDIIISGGASLVASGKFFYEK